MFFRIFDKDLNKDNYINIQNTLYQINKIFDTKNFKDWFDKLNKISNIDTDEIVFYTKKNYFQNLNIQKKIKKIKSKNCNFLSFIKYICLFFFYYFYIKIKKNYSYNTNESFLLIDGIENERDLYLYNQIIENLYPKKITINKTNNFEIKNNNITQVFFTRYKGYDTSIFPLKKFFNFLFINLFYSLKLRINLFYLFLKFIDDVLYYYTLSKYIKVNYIIDFRHYSSNNIKNFIFKKKNTQICLIQKNISQLAKSFLFYDTDVLFSFAKDSAISNKKTFSKIKKYVHVGSFFMNSNFYSKQEKNIDFQKYHKKYDIIYIGGNDICPNGKWDTYNEYKQIYNTHLDWLKKISNQFPQAKIIVKNHSNNKDTYEKRYFQNSNIYFADKNLNTYELAFESKMILSWGSTMILEFQSVTTKAFFLNPDFKNIQFVGDLNNNDLISIDTYEKLLVKYNSRDAVEKNKNLDFCLESYKTNQKIVNFLNNG
jgi:hypothetical protein